MARVDPIEGFVTVHNGPGEFKVRAAMPDSHHNYGEVKVHKDCHEIITLLHLYARHGFMKWKDLRNYYFESSFGIKMCTSNSHSFFTYKAVYCTTCISWNTKAWLLPIELSTNCGNSKRKNVQDKCRVTTFQWPFRVVFENSNWKTQTQDSTDVFWTTQKRDKTL